ncbi:MAG: hypothetical protein VYD59_01260 [Bacteroidota bacterium]|nr:hypothetical protein [Bacteroidota bacterium]
MKVFIIIISQLANIIILHRSFINRSVRFFLKKKFNKCSENVSFNAQSKFSYKSISLGNDIYIGLNTIFGLSGLYLTISDKVLFGPNIKIMRGHHNTKVLRVHSTLHKIRWSKEEIKIHKSKLKVPKH